MNAIISGAFEDIVKGLSLRRVWTALASENISDQHRRTTLGPLWLLLNYLLLTATFLVIFGRGKGIADYAAYAATGLLVWNYMSEVVTQSVRLFGREQSYISGTRLPLFVYVMRLTTQCAIRAGYAGIGWVAILMLTQTPVTPGAGWALLSIAVIAVATPAAITVFAFLGVLFPDFEFIVANVMRLGLFVTPVFWVYGGEGGLRGVLYHFNPFAHFLELLRQPILNGTFPLTAFGVSLAITALLWGAAIGLLGAFRNEVIFLL